MTQHRHRHVGRSAVRLRKPLAIPQTSATGQAPHDVWSTMRGRLIAPISENVKMPENFAKNPLSVLLRAAFLGCVIALATLAWLPAKAITRTILGGHAEHFIAYLGTSRLIVQFGRRSNWWLDSVDGTPPRRSVVTSSHNTTHLGEAPCELWLWSLPCSPYRPSRRTSRDLASRQSHSRK